MSWLTNGPWRTTIRESPRGVRRAGVLPQACAPGAHLRRNTMIHCVLHDPNDSVAVVVVEGVRAGTPLTGLILDEDRTIELECRQDIPIGHKVALKDMAVGDTVIKYGVDIGKVVQPIRKGEHAHVHNIKTKRW
jgi:(2R)-sulfolactate sulfo-lyase subunit alpha